MRKKLAIIGTVGLPAKYGGFETLAEQLVIHLEEEYEITVYCSGKFYTRAERSTHWGKAKLKYIPLQANGIQSIPYDILSIIHAAFKSDLLLILGVSGCIMLPFIKFFTKKRTFVNIDGIEWKRNKWGRLIKIFLRYSEIFAVETAEAIITDNQVITAYLKAAYDYESHTIAYGGDQAKYLAVEDQSLQKYPFLEDRYAFSVCRIEPENHIHLILEAMSEQSLPLCFIGNWKKSDYGKELLAKYQALPHFYLLDPIYERSILDVLRSNAYIYLHGHSAGGTNPSLVEAMNLGLPVIAFDVMYNRETTEHRARFFQDVLSLKEQVKALDSLEIRNELAKEMDSLAKQRYTWHVIARKYHKVMS